MKNVQELNGRWWYRFLKVVFIVFILLTIGLFSLVVYSGGTTQIDLNHTIIECKVGNKTSFTPQSKGINLNINDFVDGDVIDRGGKIEQACDTPPDLSYFGYLNRNPELIFPNSIFNIELSYNHYRFIEIIIVGNILILCFYEIVRRIFYYIALGSIKSQKLTN
jgi:hypothetical protein